MTPQERAQELADAHWGYIHALILEHGAGEELAKVVGFHYRTAFCHGYKHATEDAKETARTAFTPVQEREFPFTFPPALKWMGKADLVYDHKLAEEIDEVIKARTPRDRMMELFDVAHVAETAIRSLAEKEGLDPVEVAGEVIAKNSERNYYQG